MDQPAPPLLVALVELIKALVWPAIIFWIFHRFRAPLSELISKARLKSVKMAGTEVAFQESAPTAETAPAARSAELQVGPDGFLTVDSIRKIVVDSGLLRDGESVTAELLIFQTPKQRTWLVATSRQVFVLLDDEFNRKNRHIIQTHFPKDETLPLEFDVEDSTGIVNFAAEDTYWYYSPQLFPKPSTLTAAVKKLVTVA